MHLADYVIMSAFLATSVAIGVYHALTGGRQRTTAEFIMANRNQGLIPTVVSLVVSYLSALIIIGASAETYAWGTHMGIIGSIGYSLALMASERIVVPWLYPLRLVSVFEYFELRFQSRVTRIMGSFLGVIWGILYIGTAIYAPSIALQIATGFPLNISIPLMAIVCTIYTAIGGMRAVIWTDVFQFLVMISGMAAVVIKGSIMVGGYQKAWDVAKQQDRLVLYEVLLLTIPFVSLMFTIAYSTGMFVLAHYAQKECDPIGNGDVTDPNQVLGFFVNEAFFNYKGFMGFFLATLYSGSLSSVSSSLSGAAANTWEDMLKWKFSHFTDYQATLVNKALVVLYGVVGAAIAFLAAEMPGPVSSMCDAFLGAAGGPLIGMFFLGGVFRSAEWVGTTIGGAVSIIVTLWICMMGSLVNGYKTPLPPLPTNGCIPLNLTTSTPAYMYTGSQHTHVSLINVSFPLLDFSKDPHNINLTGVDHIYAVSFVWYPVIGIILCMLTGLPISMLIQRFYKKTDAPEYLLLEWKQLIMWTCDETKLCSYRPTKRAEQTGNNKEAEMPTEESRAMLEVNSNKI